MHKATLNAYFEVLSDIAKREDYIEKDGVSLKDGGTLNNLPEYSIKSEAIRRLLKSAANAVGYKGDIIFERAYTGHPLETVEQIQTTIRNLAEEVRKHTC
jgi:hypothetical protein